MDTPVSFLKSLFIRILLILDALFIILLIIFNLSPIIVEVLYSKGLYLFLAFFMGRVTDIVRFSITELVFFVLIITLSIRLILSIYRVLKKQRSLKNLFFHFLKQSFILISIIFISFYIVWGFNYLRRPLEEKTDRFTTELNITDELFEDTLFSFIEKANELYLSNVARRGHQYRELEKIVDKAVNKAIIDLDGNNISPAIKSKTSITNILENSNTLGMISPFFLESHLSKELIESELPFIMAHEKVHLYGYANEAEANYIAFVACAKSKDTHLRYSAYTQILRYFLSQYKRNLRAESVNLAEKEKGQDFADLEPETQKEYLEYANDKYETTYNKLRSEIRDDYLKQAERYHRHNTAFSKTISKIYNVYLIVNNVPDGIISYSHVVEMILRTKSLGMFTDTNSSEREFENIKIDEDEYHYGIEDKLFDIDEIDGEINNEDIIDDGIIELDPDKDSR